MPLLLPIGFFLLLDLISIFVLGQLIGAWVLLVIVLAAAFGIHLIRREGVGAFREAQARMADGETASTELRRGAALMLAGVLLVMPGILTDIMALFCLVPASRGALLSRFLRGEARVRRYRPGRHHAGETFTREETDNSRQGSTLEGEFIEHEDERQR